MQFLVYWLFDRTCTDPRIHGYIGATSRLSSRLNTHRYNRHVPRYFKWKILFQGSKEECLAYELKLRPNLNIGWNRKKGGYIHTDETYLKISKALKGHPKSPEWREKIAQSLTGHVRSKASRLKQSQSTRGIPKSLEHRKNMRIAALRRYSDPAEHKLMSKAMKRSKAHRRYLKRRFQNHPAGA